MYLYLFLLSLDTSSFTNKNTLATRGEKVRFLGTILKIVAFDTPQLAVKLLFRDRKTTRSFLPTLRNEILRLFLLRVNGRQLQSCFPSTVDVLKYHCGKRKVALSTEALDHGAVLHWMGDGEAEKVVLYSHGGGYNVPALDGHARFLQLCISHLSKQGHKVAVAWVGYGLAPQTKYPTQYRQATECLRHLLSKGYSPSNIIVAGDSAGAAMTLAVLSHIAHKHPDIAELRLPEGEKLAGALLLCPFSNLQPDCASYEENKRVDYVHPAIVREWSGYFVDGGREKWDGYCNPQQVTGEWWKGLRGVVGKCLVVGGGRESLRDDIVELGGRIMEGAGGEGGVEVEVKVVEKETHIECIMDAGMGLRPGEMAETVWEWLGRVW